MNELQSIKKRFGIIGHAPDFDRALEAALRVAPTDLAVMVTGESGVGKEFFPQVIHAHSARKHHRLIAVNCGAIPEGTIDSELFGHEKGAFTGATDLRRGYFEEADGGTIFLDEVGELPTSTQVRLLRVLQTGEFIRVGSSTTRKSDVRVVAATNVDLHRALEAGRFREDLYYRLCTVPIAVPPLRERREDVFLLFRKFASDVALQYRMPPIALDEGARAMLENYYWPGNIRQLKNVAEQLSAVEPERHITAAVLAGYLPEGVGAARIAPIPPSPDSEREILYKLLFDMRAELHEVRAMLAAATSGAYSAPPPAPPVVAGLLPAAPQYAPAQDVTHTPARTKQDAQREQIIAALRRNGGRRRDAAAELFVSERTLYRKIKELGIDED